MMTPSAAEPVGHQLRAWRLRRRMSQLDLAGEADISTRHLSFMETGRALPSRDMLLRLAQRLEIPLRAQNALLLAAGYAPMFRERPLDDPAMDAAREAVALVLAGHEPYPALAVNRRWEMLAANAAVGRLQEGVDPALLAPPVNVLRLGLHPQGLAPRILNLAQWREHLLHRLDQQIAASADPALIDLARELHGYPVPDSSAQAPAPWAGNLAVAVPCVIQTAAGRLALLSTTTIFGTPVDVTLSELAIESFFPADAATAAILRELAGGA
jgi:transcriptional regulator with XRE-family HTH domain